MLDLLETDDTTDLESRWGAEWQRLVRFCAHVGGDPHAAEDLAQETLIEAWHHAGALRNRAALPAWLFGIARNVCRRQNRREGREARHRVPAGTAGLPYNLEDEPAGTFDLEIELERGELAALLDRALALLPPTTRSALVARYVLELPQAEISSRLGVSEGAVEARLHRGKLALRRVLAAELREEAVAHGLATPDPLAWQETRIWCPFCGRRKLAGLVDHDLGDAAFRCFHCESIPERQISHTFGADVLGGVTSYKAVLSRQIGWLHRHYRFALDHSQVSCPFCGQESRVERCLPRHAPPWFAGSAGMQIICPACGITDANPLQYLVLDLPQTQQFWRTHPRMRVLPDRPITFQGHEALLTTYESVDGSARLEAVSDAQTLKVLRVHTSPGAPPSIHTVLAGE